ncbi:MAG: DUF5320 family protein [Alphaproteobacteria bacterium]
MPAMDKTGPFGTGPVGRGMGPCQQENASPQGQWGGGRGQGQGRGQNWGRGGRGFGRGMGRKGGGGGWFGSAPAITPEEEAEMLERQISAMQARVKALKTNDTPSE